MTPITHQIPETNCELLIVAIEKLSPVNEYGVVRGAFRQFLNNYGVDCTELPMGKTWQLLGLLSELTEEKLEGVMRKVTQGYWFDYTKPNARHDYMCSTPKESFQSLMQFLQVYTKNPYGETKPKLVNSQHVLYQKKINHFKLWQEAQERLIKDAAVLVRKIANNLPQSN